MNLIKNVVIIVMHIGIIAILIMSIIALSKEQSFLNSPFTLMAIESDSMRPTLKAGDIILTYRNSDYKEGDIVSYRLDAQKILTHRVVSKTQSKGNISYLTKGDANNVYDKKVAAHQLLGRVILVIPYIGFLKSVILSRTGFILYICLLSVIIIANMAYLASGTAKALQHNK